MVKCGAIGLFRRADFLNGSISRVGLEESISLKLLDAKRRAVNPLTNGNV
jgi:hypothetical protein